MQIFGDGAGSVVALGERDCSAQRRNQKVIEETPAPGSPTPSRAALLDAAVRLGRAVHYRSAGTVEFIYDNDTGEFYFLEVNTRLQVEHGVTEEVTGVDLVEWMVRLAAGEMPPLDASRFDPRGARSRCALYAEDPAQGLPAQRRDASRMVAWPAGARVETWVESGTEVTPYYDPMLAKIIVPAQIARRRWRACAPRWPRAASPASKPISNICARSSPTPRSRQAASPPRSCATSTTAAAPST